MEAVRMQFLMSEGTQVTIVVGKTPMLAVSDQAMPPTVEPLPTRAPAEPPVARPRRLLLKSAVGVVLLFAAYQVGRHNAAPFAAIEAARASVYARLPNQPGEPAIEPGDAPAIPATGHGQAPTPAAAEVPPAFRQQLTEQPHVTPPPGQRAAPPSASPFGLHE